MIFCLHFDEKKKKNTIDKDRVSFESDPSEMARAAGLIKPCHLCLPSTDVVWVGLPARGMQRFPEEGVSGTATLNAGARKLPSMSFWPCSVQSRGTMH
jgi:hypothetical protein